MIWIALIVLGLIVLSLMGRMDLLRDQEGRLSGSVILSFIILVLAIGVFARGLFIPGLVLGGLSLGLGVYSLLRQRKQKSAGALEAQMSRAEALEVLGLQHGATATDIRTAHKEKMKEVHPDRGGDSALASKLNQARDLLLRLAAK